MTFLRSRIGTVFILTFIRNLSVALKAGVSLPRALRLFEEDQPKAGQPVLTHLRRSVEAGQSLGDAMQHSPKKFPPLVHHLVRTGELGGTLQKNLEEIVRHLSRSLDLKRKIRNAMMYPSFVFAAVTGLGLSVGILVLPEIIPLFESLDVDLPFMTRILLRVAAYFRDYGVVTAIVLAIGIALFLMLARMERFKPAIHRMALMIPYIRRIQCNAAVAQLCGTLAALLRSGIPIKDAIPATADAVSNRVFSRALRQALPVIQSGRTLHEGLARMEHLFPKMALTLISVAEETGTLAETLEYIADFYEGEVDYALKNLTTSLEPILLILIGFIVGGTVLAIITPIYDVTGSIR